MVESLIAILSSSGLGGLIGGFFGWLNRKEERKDKELEFTHQIQMANLALQEAGLMNQHQLDIAKSRLDETKVKGEQEVEKTDANTFGESVKQSFKVIGIKFVDAIRFLVRPVITVYLLVHVSILAYHISALVGGLEALPMDELMYLYRYVIAQSFFLATTAVTWWFSSRKSGNSLKIG